MAVRRCENRSCRSVLPMLARSDARFCRDACRVAAHRAAGRRVGLPFPAELVECPRWIRHSADKVPLRCDGSGAASSTNPRTWSTWVEACRSAVGVGLGFVLAGDGVVCVDLDHCVDAGVVAPWAARLLELAGPTYVEVSRSGAGLHIWGRGVVGRGRVLSAGDVRVEVYGQGRYIAMGSRHGDAPLRLGDLGGLLGALTRRAWV